ncbi:AAA family ATPase [Enterococcus gilvus]|uniref:AAA family ATPase n=1 Tax=Enterococcus gilvus TaxID=160453 RepID=UPI003EDAB372
MEKIVLFKGSKKDFQELLSDNYVGDDYTPFMELIRQYNAAVRANDISATDDLGTFDHKEIENVVIYADDFASVTSHVITNFPNIVILGHNIQNLYIQNAPKRVEYSLRVTFDEVIEEKFSDYHTATPEEVVDIFKELNDDTVIGQENAKKQSSIGIYKSAVLRDEKPLVLLYYGPSGVGKTELAKKISNHYNGKLTRLQFSMMQTDESYKYIFGDEHGKASFARDLLARETNIILIDEFDKVNSGLYNVFYQMFDEGEFEDINYQVDVSNCIFILTSNFLDEKDIVGKVGFPIYSRIDNKIKFENLTDKELRLVIDKIFASICGKLSEKQVEIVNKSGLLDRYFDSLEIFKNVRLLYKYIENDIFTILFENNLLNTIEK